MANEYIASVTLVVLGDDLEPGQVTSCLGIEPDQAWVRDENRGWGGWKKFVPADMKGRELHEQILFWTDMLAQYAYELTDLSAEGKNLALDCFVQPRGEDGGTASILLSPDLLSSVAALGLELHLSFWS